MPLKAILNESPIYSFEYSTEQWADLKSSYKHDDQDLVMHCCGVAAVPKTSSQGLQFFAHKVTGDCDSQAESPEHEFVKFEIAKAVHEYGWTVETEKSGVSESGDEWRADVYCSKDGVKIAFEVQHSRQSWKELEERQQRYMDSGVRCAWFLNGKVFKHEELVAKQSKELPAFSYELEKIGLPTEMDCFEVCAGDFSVGLLGKRLKWVRPEPLGSAEICEFRCWKCGSNTRTIIGLSDSDFDNGRELSTCIHEAYGKLKIPLSFYAEQDIEKPRIRTSKDGEVLHEPICHNCKATQGVYQLADDIWNFVNPYNSKESSVVAIFSVDFPMSGALMPGQWVYGNIPFKVV